MSDLHGWYLNKSNDDYHSGPGLSKTDLMNLIRSPAHYKAPRKEETPAMIQGEAFHLYTLQRELFEEQFAVLPQGLTRVHKEGKAFAAEAEAKGKAIISYEVFEQIKGMCEAFRAHPLISEILEYGHAEVSGFWNDLRYPEILCKIRPDWIASEINALLDLKSTTDAREKPFTSIAYDKGYHIQAGYYTYGAEMITGVEHKDFYFAAVEREPPYGVLLYKADEEMIMRGRIEANKAIEIYHSCSEKNYWPCYSTEMSVLSLPGWVRRKDMILG